MENYDDLLEVRRYNKDCNGKKYIILLIPSSTGNDIECYIQVADGGHLMLTMALMKSMTNDFEIFIDKYLKSWVEQYDVFDFLIQENLV